MIACCGYNIVIDCLLLLLLLFCVIMFVIDCLLLLLLLLFVIVVDIVMMFASRVLCHGYNVCYRCLLWSLLL